MNKILHFTIGPVQSFVGQSRRMRDLWAGSFLLSWLAGQAMAAVRLRGGTIVFPVVENNKKIIDPLLKAIVEGKLTPHIGSIPNRFKAEFIDENIKISDVENHVREKWKNLADAVWETFIKETAILGKDTKVIWDKQINRFWELNWVFAEKDEAFDDGAWLDMRKNWRSHWPIVQAGDHCTLMGDWQEISGFMRSQNRQHQDTFWQSLQDEKVIGRLDLRNGERLCAIALVKRLFPKLSKVQLDKTIGWVPGGALDKVGNWPSTSYMAALPWLTAHEDKKQAFSDYIHTLETTIDKKSLRRLSSERATGILRLSQLPVAIVQLDGNLFHLDALQNFRATPLTNRSHDDLNNDIDKNERAIIVKALKKLCHSDNTGNNAQPFYAILLMDGDNMGKLLRDYDNDAISNALLKFAKSANDIVEDHQGVLIYAGGDDVLAIVSMTEVIECSHALQRAYRESFECEDKLKGNYEKFTISAAIIYAHYHAPLNRVLQHAHTALDDVAKHQNDRNSLVIRVIKSENVSAQWVGKFTDISQHLASFIEELKLDKSFSNGFFYNLKARHPVLYQTEYESIPSNEKRAILLSEYCKGKSKMSLSEMKLAENSIERLLNACGKQKGTENNIDTDNYLQLDAAYIGRFIVENGTRFSRIKGEDVQ